MTTQPSPPSKDALDNVSTAGFVEALLSGISEQDSDDRVLELARKSFNKAASKSSVAVQEEFADGAGASTGTVNVRGSADLVNVIYDRLLLSETFTDPLYGQWRICGLAMHIRFDHALPAAAGRSEPVGADALQAQLRVSYSPEVGIGFHHDHPNPRYQVEAYEVSVELRPFWSAGVEVDKATFDGILERNAQYFIAEDRLQSTAYSLVKV